MSTTSASVLTSDQLREAADEINEARSNRRDYLQSQGALIDSGRKYVWCTQRRTKQGEVVVDEELVVPFPKAPATPEAAARSIWNYLSAAETLMAAGVNPRPKLLPAVDVAIMAMEFFPHLEDACTASRARGAIGALDRLHRARRAHRVSVEVSAAATSARYALLDGMISVSRVRRIDGEEVLALHAFASAVASALGSATRKPSVRADFLAGIEDAMAFHRAALRG